jgi:hypothetical protein
MCVWGTPKIRKRSNVTILVEKDLQGGLGTNQAPRPECLVMQNVDSALGHWPKAMVTASRQEINCPGCA